MNLAAGLLLSITSAAFAVSPVRRIGNSGSGATAGQSLIQGITLNPVAWQDLEAARQCRSLTEGFLKSRAERINAEISPLRENANSSGIKEMVQEALTTWASEDRDYCPGAEIDHSDSSFKVMNGRWVPTPDSELHNHFEEKEVNLFLKAHTKPLRSKCMPDGTCRRFNLVSSNEPLKWHWSGCDNGACGSMADLAKQMVSSNRKRLLIMGDSLYAQFFEAGECSLERKGCKVKMMPPACEESCTSKRVTCGTSEIEYTYFVFGKLNEFKFEGKARQVPIDRLRMMLRASDVVVANQGAHGSDRRDEFVAELMAAMNDKPSLRLFWGETTAAHFKSPTGLVQGAGDQWRELSKVSAVNTFCVPLQKAGLTSWDHVTLPGNITSLPFWKLSMHRWDMHSDWSMVDSGGAKNLGAVKDGKLNTQPDCLHYCYSPTFYEPFIGLLVEAFQNSHP